MQQTQPLTFTAASAEACNDLKGKDGTDRSLEQMGYMLLVFLKQQQKKSYSFD